MIQDVKLQGLDWVSWRDRERPRMCGLHFPYRKLKPLRNDSLKATAAPGVESTHQGLSRLVLWDSGSSPLAPQPC